MSAWSRVTDAQSVYDALGRHGPLTKLQLFARTTCRNTQAVEKAVQYINYAPMTEFTDGIVSPYKAPWQFRRVARSDRDQYASWLRDERYLQTRLTTSIAMRKKAIDQGGVSTTRLLSMGAEATYLQTALDALQHAIVELDSRMGTP